VRCLVIAARGRTTIRARSGALLHTVATGLPGGHPGTAGGPVALDAVLQPDALTKAGAASAPHLPGTLYAVDLLSWGGLDLTAGDAEFRVAWLASKLADEVVEAEGAEAGSEVEEEDGRAGGRPPPTPWVPVRGLPTWPADPAGLAAAARWPAGGGPGTLPRPIPDGVLLRHRAAPYAAGAPTPLALLWKDSGCSRHLLDGADGWDGRAGGGAPPPPQVALLRVGSGSGAGLSLETGDDPPLALAAAGLDGAVALPRAALPPGAAPGALLRVIVSPAGFVFDPADGHPVGLAVACLGLAGGRRPGRADPISKMLFQWGVRHGGGVSLAGLCAAAAEVVGGDDGEGMAG
jgi:snurportin-1